MVCIPSVKKIQSKSEIESLACETADWQIEQARFLLSIQNPYELLITRYYYFFLATQDS
jgi:hypothetical protein